MGKNEFVCDCNIIHQESVDEVQKKMPNAETFLELSNFFKILGDYTRIKILFALDQKENMEKKVLEKGLIQEAQDKAETSIQTFIQSSNHLSEEYTFDFHVIE